MDWVSATYNRLEIFAMAADRVLGTVVERCESWLAGHTPAKRQPDKGKQAEAGKSPLSA